MEFLNFDTSFLVDFQREFRSKLFGPAHTFLQDQSATTICLSVVALAEFAEGFASLSDARYLSITNYFKIQPVTSETASIYSRISRALRSTGTLIDTNDMWIAAASLENGHPLVTKNTAHFARIPGLQIRSY